MKVETVEKWNEIEQKLRERDYHVFQFQYDTNQAEGWHVTLISIGTGLPQVEVVTHSEEVRAAILRYIREFNARNDLNQ
jgi:hypothetical protein